MRRTAEYQVTVHPDGSWCVSLREYYDDGPCITRGVASGSAEDQRRGELAARAKERVEASMVQHFTVPA